MLNANHAALRDSFATQQFNFIFVEIELGLTFCQTANMSSSPAFASWRILSLFI